MTPSRTLFAAALALALALCACTPQPQVKPSQASQGISSQALDVSGTSPGRAALAAAKPVVAPRAMVVTAQHLATQVGVDILKAGGNAIDAAVAIGYALAVVQPCCGNIGGGGFMVIHLADGKNLFLNFREKAPLAATSDMFLNAQGQVIEGASSQGWLAIGIPGTVMGLNAALDQYGTLPRARVMAPAIRLAEDGYVLREGDVKILHTSTDKFRAHPHAAEIFLNDGQPWQVGDRLLQTRLAATLKRIARLGNDGFYQGPVAKALVQASQAHGGLFTMRDFANYTVEWRPPVHCSYQGYDILSAAPPSSGGVTVCEILEILEPYPLDEWGYGSVKATHYMVEAERHAYADRNTALGDPDFVDNPIDALLSDANIKAIRQQIQAHSATPSSQVQGGVADPEGRHTTHYSVVDASGNAVAVTYTVNYLFGMGGIAGDTGFFLNNEMDDFTAKPGVPNGFGLVQDATNRVEPGKRPLSSMSPTIVLKDGELFMLTGSPGGSTIITTAVQTIVNVIDFDMNIRQAVAAPRFHHQWLPDVVMVEPDYLTAATGKALKAMGYRFKQRPSWGAAEAILRDPATDMLQGASDPRRSAGLAAGY